MQKASSFNNPINETISLCTFHGKGSFNFGGESVDADFIIICSNACVYIKFPVFLHPFITIEGASFIGKLDDGSTCHGCLDGEYMMNDVVIARCKELVVGDIEEIGTIETTLAGVYIPREFSFYFQEYDIAFKKSIHTLEVAKRSHKLSGVVLEGNSIKVSGKNLNIDKVNDLFGSICLLLRSLSASDVYFGFLKCNHEAIVFHRKRMHGIHFGFRQNILETSLQIQEYICKGLNTLETINKFDKRSILDIGYALSTSAGCGLLETGLMALTTSLERLGQKASGSYEKSSKASKLNDSIRQIKDFLKEQATQYIKEQQVELTTDQQKNILDSISKIQPWDAAFIKKVKAHLAQNGWETEINFNEIKLLRDSLAHTGSLPKELSIDKVLEIQVQLEAFLFVHILDIIGFNGRIKSSENGWAVYPWKEEIKGNDKE